MKLPVWLYLKRESEYDTIWRFGSRQPLRLCLAVIQDKSVDPMPPTYLFALGRLHLSYGSADGICEGLTGKERWSHLFVRKNGTGLLVGWLL